MKKDMQHTPESTPVDGSGAMAWLKSQQRFLGFLCVSMIVAILAAPTPHIAMWVGFCFAAYSAIACGGKVEFGGGATFYNATIGMSLHNGW